MDGDVAMMIAGQCTPHFLFGLAEKKTGRARSKRKERLAQNLHMRAGLLNTGVFRIYADEDLMASYWLAPDCSVAQVLRHDCWSGGNFGVVIERPVLLAPLARYPGDRWGLGTGECGHPPLRGGSPYKRCPVGADALVGPRLPPGQHQRRAQQTSGPAPAERAAGGIRDYPGPKVSPRASRLIRVTTREGQPSPAGGRRYALARTDPP